VLLPVPRKHRRRRHEERNFQSPDRAGSGGRAFRFGGDLDFEEIRTDRDSVISWRSVRMNPPTWNASTVDASNATPISLERHYTVSEVAQLWSLSDNTIRKVFRDEPGVLRTQLPSLRARKRQNISLRIPESVVYRVHGRMSVN